MLGTGGVPPHHLLLPTRPWPSLSPSALSLPISPKNDNHIVQGRHVKEGLVSWDAEFKFFPLPSQSPLLWCYHPPWSQPTGRCLRVIDRAILHSLLPPGSHHACFRSEGFFTFPLPDTMDTMPTLLSWDHFHCDCVIGTNPAHSAIIWSWFKTHILIGGEMFWTRSFNHIGECHKSDTNGHQEKM